MTANSIKEADKDDVNSEAAVQSIKDKCADCLKGPNLLKTVVVLGCTAIVVQQIWVCVYKLIDVPITTHTHFDFNKTLIYPSVTFCREPPYKFDKLEEYGLYAHPRFTAAWLRFNFSSVDLDQLWNDITYDDHEFFVQYGLDGQMENIEFRSTLGFVHGRCHTIIPKVLVTHASKETGYSITLQHNQNDVATSTSIHPPGYHVYVHYTREPFTEVQVYNGGLVDYLYVNMGETMDIKLTVDQYNMISSPEDPCTNDFNYSANNCTSEHVWDLVTETSGVGCSGPWMSTSTLPRCNNFSNMSRLMTTYMNIYNRNNNALCPRFCQALMYNAFVSQRQTMYSWDSAQLNWALTTGGAALQSQIYMHFNSMMVSVYEERYNYDWNNFLADLGGSVGFLLGLSVIGLITIVGKMWITLVTPFFKTTKVKNDESIANSTVTAQLDDLYLQRGGDQENMNNQEYFKKCNEWSLKNLKD